MGLVQQSLQMQTFSVESLNRKTVKKMAEQRLIDANIMAQDESEAYLKAQTSGQISPITQGLNSVVHRKIQQLIADTPTIDLETLPIVRQLREELALVKEERDSAVKDIETAMSYEYADDIWRFLCSICQNKLPEGKCKCTGTVCIPKWAGIRKDK